MLHNSIVSKRTITFSISVIAALSLFLAAGPIVSNQKVFAANLCGSGLGCGGASDYGCDGCGGISYPSPLSNFFGGEAFHFHHFHGGFGFDSTNVVPLPTNGSSIRSFLSLKADINRFGN